MRKKFLHVDWGALNGAAVKRRMLKLVPNEEGQFLCPVSTCLHVGFKSARGVRKHVNATHPWYIFFDEQPRVDRKKMVVKREDRRRSSTHNMPAFSLQDGVGSEFLNWLNTACGGGKTKVQGVQIGRRAMKFLMASLPDAETESKVSEEYLDCCLGSPSIIISFLKKITNEWKVSSSAALNYMKAINDLMDFRKSNGVTDDVLRSFAVAEVYIRRGKENLAKKKKMEYSRNLDLEQLICRRSWATVQEMEQVIPYHTPKYKYVLQQCRKVDVKPTISELAFATRFITTFLFLRVKCSRPMTYQFITLEMVDQAKKNGGFIDQTAFKTEEQYAFDTVVLSLDVLHVLDSYINTIRPLLKPTCQYLLLTTNGKQYNALGSAMSLLVHQAIDKYVNPTRYRQIIESESAEKLTTQEMEVVSKDQKHSSYVARRIYQKKLSRDVALQGKSCMVKLLGTDRDNHTKEMATTIAEVPLHSDAPAENALADAVESIEIDDNNDNSDNNDMEEVKHSDDLMDLTVAACNDNCILTVTTTANTIPMERTTTVATAVSSMAVVSSSGPSADQEFEVEVKREEVEYQIARLKRFTSEEDQFLREGIKKHGLGKWSVILKDTSFSFHPGRNRDALRMRADTLCLTKKKNQKRKQKNT